MQLSKCFHTLLFSFVFLSSTNAQSILQTFNYTGSLQTYVVPAGVNSIVINASGAQGGNSGGLGAKIIGTITVLPGETLSVMVGGQGGMATNNDGGGGGGTFVWRNTGNVLLIGAGGGGGKSGSTGIAGAGSADSIPTSSGNGAGNGVAGNGGKGGGGGTSTAGYPGGGGGSGWLTSGGTGVTTLGATGGVYPLLGGAGGVGYNNCSKVYVHGGFGGGGGAAYCSGASGGGGGYNGGGGGNGFNGSVWGSGGGGSSYNSGTNQSNAAGVKTGNGTVTFGSPGAGALNFGNGTNYISVNTSLGNVGANDFTIQMRVRFTSNSLMYLISKRGSCGHDNFISLQANNGKLNFELDNNNSPYLNLLGNTPINDGNWHQVTATRSNGIVKLYVDGTLDVSANCTANINNSYPLTIGASVCNGTNGSVIYNGDMDELRFWNRSLCPGEIQSSVSCELASGQTGITAYYKFNEGMIASGNPTVDTLFDAVGSNNGILYSFTLSGTSSNWIIGSVSGMCNAFVPPSANISSGGNTTICPGSSVTLSANTGTGYTYVWLNNGVNIFGTGSTTFWVGSSYNATTPGNYSVIVSVNGCSATSTPVAVSVNTSPNFTACPSNSNQTANVSANNCAATVNYSAFVAGIPAPALSYIFTGATTGTGDGTGSGSSFNKGVTTVTIKAVNSCGSVNCSFTVTVLDSIAPIVHTQNIMVQLDTNGSATVSASQVNNGSTDNCAISSYGLSKTSFNCSNIGLNYDTLSVTDASGNVSTGVALITVQDNVAPTVITQNVTISLNAGGTANITPSQINNGSTDNCSLSSYSLSRSTFNCSNIGSNVVTLTVTDANGNSSTGNATVTIRDNTAPTAIAKNITVTLSGGTASISVAQVDNGSYDNCSIASMSVSPNSFTCSNIGNNTVTLTVTDASGNISTATSTVTVVGAVPTASISQGVTQGFSQGGAVVLTASSPTANSYNWTNGPSTPIYNVYASGTFFVTVTNSHGCMATASSTVSYNSNNLLSSYSVIANKTAKFNNHSIINNGGVGVISTDDDDDADFENYSNATATGTFVRAKHILTGSYSAANNKIYSAMPSTIVPAFLSNHYCGNSSCSNGHHNSCIGIGCTHSHHSSCSGSGNKRISNYGTATITDSVIGEMVVGKYATVTFTSQNIYIKGLEVDEGATILFSQCAVIKVCNSLNIQQGVHFNTTNNYLVNIYVGNDFSVDEGSSITANVYAQGDISINGDYSAPTVMKGMFIGEEIEAEGYVGFYWNTNTVCPSSFNKTGAVADESGLIKNYFDVNVYPNPALTSFNVRLFSSSIEPFRIDVFDMTGKLIESASSGGSLSQEMGSDYSDGMYIIRITQGENTKTSRLVKITK
ncbi:MAG: LamG-like jellyroll fold domain-containing protein [Bacteroidia bacterium]